MKTFIKNLIGAANIQTIRDLLQQGENEQVKHARRSFYSQFLSPEDLCFDVGANMGNRVEILLSLGCRVVAIEPQPECCKYLKRKFGNRIDLVQKGLGPAEEIRNLHISDAHTVSSFSQDWIESVQQSRRFGSIVWQKSTPVQMTTVDNLIEIFGTPAFLKIDVEGFELEVLKGLSSPVRMISFEYTVPEQTSKAVECIQHLAQIKKDKIVTCNYSVGESMLWGFNEWLAPEKMVDFVKSKAFMDTNFGDIYIRCD